MELVTIWRPIVAHFKALTGHLHEVADEKYENPDGLVGLWVVNRTPEPPKYETGVFSANRNVRLTRVTREILTCLM
jgi:hypothetical protein